VAVGAEPRGQPRRVRVVEFDVKRAALCPNGNGLIQPSVLEPKVIEETQRLTGEPPQLVMVALGRHLRVPPKGNNPRGSGNRPARPRMGRQRGGLEPMGR